MCCFLWLETLSASTKLFMSSTKSLTISFSCKHTLEKFPQGLNDGRKHMKGGISLPKKV